MNNPEGYVLVQVKQLAQWREWANNVAAWSTKADRSSEVARLKASISSAMISATQPTASNAGERDLNNDEPMTIAKCLRKGYKAEAWLSGGTGPVACVGICNIQLQGWTHTKETAEGYAKAYNDGVENMRAALASKPVAPPAREALTDKEIDALMWQGADTAREQVRRIVRAGIVAYERKSGLAQSLILSATPPAQAVQDKIDAERWRVARESPLLLFERWDSVALPADGCDAAVDEAIRAARSRGNGVEPS